MLGSDVLRFGRCFLNVQQTFTADLLDIYNVIFSFFDRNTCWMVIYNISIGDQSGNFFSVYRLQKRLIARQTRR